MFQDCRFRKGADISETVRGQAVDIPDSIDYSRIKDTSVPSQYNMQKTTDEVGHRIREPFDVIEYDRSYSRFRKQINDKEYEKSKSKGE